MRRKFGLALAAISELGLLPISLYAVYELQRRLGWIRLKTPVKDWNEFREERYWSEGNSKSPVHYYEYRSRLDRSFFIAPEGDLSSHLSGILAGNEDILLAEADGILKGQFRLFSGQPQSLEFPPKWNLPPHHLNLDENDTRRWDVHWSKIDIDGFPWDVKLIWELSRFSWVFVLGRAFRLTGNDTYAEAFWELLNSWREVNPPNQGPQWISAQEVAIRLLALIFGHYSFYSFTKDQPERLVILTETIAAHAHRIPPTLLYSRAQGNNHLIVESAALYSAGLLFPELRGSSEWHQLGRRWMISAVSDQVFSDGGYVQHSINYQRLALQASLWAIRLGELNGDEFYGSTWESLQKMTICLEAFVDADSGLVPNYGSNDGALIFPLTTCSFSDYRPIVQCANRVLSRRDSYGPGAWDEESYWFGLLPDSLVTPESKAPTFEIEFTTDLEAADGPKKMGRSFPKAGVHLLGGNETWGYLRCGKFNSRPGHSDQLNLDLWWRGENIARDPGTYLYNGEDPWENSMATSKVHNTLIVDELEPMKRAGRFLWLAWAQGEIRSRNRNDNGSLEFISGHHDGYSRLGIKAIRSVIRAKDERWLVLDELKGTGTHKLRSGWLLPDWPWSMEGNSFVLDGRLGKLTIEFPTDGAQWGLYRGGELILGEQVTDCEELLGWFSPTYAYKEPGLYYSASVEAELPSYLITSWSLGDQVSEELVLEWEEIGEHEKRISKITYGHEVLDI